MDTTINCDAVTEAGVVVAASLADTTSLGVSFADHFGELGWYLTWQRDAQVSTPNELALEEYAVYVPFLHFRTPGPYLA